ncbi:unnamed protein product [Mytilus edulis]|uniref:Uncharacterized protein n=1 Tax=Mytilus edulis TaxID=6550 RepID=A0A8S3U417_MYTED|nr:unnamed protein product [Mytilus edulis]
MPPVRKKRVSSKKSKKSDTPVVQNSNTELTLDEVKGKLRKQGIRAPSTFTKEQLLELLNENSGQDNTVMPEIPALTQLTTSLNNMEQTVQNQGTLIQSLLVRESNIISQPAFVSDINNGVHHDTGSYHTTKVSSGMFPHVQAVAPNVRKQILEGKYINLATLLNNQENVQDYKTVDESDGSVLLIKHRDPRLQRNLSIQEFLEAFNIYKNIICEKQDRRIEFDMYIQDIIDISARYKGPVFYEYHKAFANKVAAIKLTHGKVVDWSIRDEKLYSSITSGQIIKECETCGSLGGISQLFVKRYQALVNRIIDPNQLIIKLIFRNHKLGVTIVLIPIQIYEDALFFSFVVGKCVTISYQENVSRGQNVHSPMLILDHLLVLLRTIGRHKNKRRPRID